IAGLLFAATLAIAACSSEGTGTNSGGFGPGTAGGGTTGGGTNGGPTGGTTTRGTTTGGTTTAAAGSIQFISATPNVIGVTGSGQPTTAVVVFLVADATGVPISGAAVDF